MNYQEWKNFATPKISTRYGASMGRTDSHYRDEINENMKLSTRRVYLDTGGYDAGGAYWGLGEALYLTYNIDMQVKFYHRGKNF